ncbi:MAG: hypothetical protein WD399_07095 [Thermoleophilaceae bacterium]
MIEERAYAKVNLVLRVGPPRADGLHPLCSLFASLELADAVRVEWREAPPHQTAVDIDMALPATPGAAVVPPVLDEVVCAGVDGDNLAAAAAAAFRAAAPVPLPPLRVEIDKRIPVAAGLAGGSADAAAVLRAANALAGSPLSAHDLRRVAAGLGSDVPSQVQPRHAIVTGVGERVEPVDLPGMALVLVPQEEGLSTAAVYAELDRLRAERPGHGATVAEPHDLDFEPLRALAQRPLDALVPGLTNDLEPAARSLRPELAEPIATLRDAGALAAQVTGSGPTVFGVFAERAAAERAATSIAGSIVTEPRA